MLQMFDHITFVAHRKLEILQNNCNFVFVFLKNGLKQKLADLYLTATARSAFDANRLILKRGTMNVNANAR